MRVLIKPCAIMITDVFMVFLELNKTHTSVNIHMLQALFCVNMLKKTLFLS